MSFLSQHFSTKKQFDLQTTQKVVTMFISEREVELQSKWLRSWFKRYQRLPPREAGLPL